MFDATVSGYLYHKTGRECWLDHQGTPNPFQRKANTNDWLRRFNWTKTVVKVPVPANIRSLDMCQALNSTDETIGIGIYLEFAREKFYRSVAKLKSRTKDPTLFVCYDDILSDGGRVQTERRIRSFIGQSLNASATSGDKLRRRLNLAGHSTDPDPELRARLRDIARNIDCTYFGCETTAWNDALEECRDETTMAAAPSSGNGTQSKEELMSSFPNETKATRENVVDDPHARDGRPLNILALGGSVTWGSALADRRHAYPFRLQDDKGHKVTNAAIPATDSAYAAHCITSILRAEEEDETSVYDPTVPFDVIVLEYSVNGFSYFDLLLKRLSDRYPDAVLIYVDHWAPGGKFESQDAQRLVRNAGGFIYDFHQDILDHFNMTKDEEYGPNVVALFAADGKHLSYLGHDLVKENIIRLLEKHQTIPHPRLGPWHGGDTCYSWFKGGDQPFNIVEGASLQKWDAEQNKWALEIEEGGAIFEYVNRDDDEAQSALSLQFMTKMKDPHNPQSSKYPPALVIVENNLDDIAKARNATQGAKLTYDLDKKSENFELTDNEGREWTYLSGIHTRVGQRRYHVTDVRKVGTLQSGRNHILVLPTRRAEYPFRITGSITCFACLTVRQLLMKIKPDKERSNKVRYWVRYWNWVEALDEKFVSSENYATNKDTSAPGARGESIDRGKEKVANALDEAPDSKHTN